MGAIPIPLGTSPVMDGRGKGEDSGAGVVSPAPVTAPRGGHRAGVNQQLTFTHGEGRRAGVATWFPTGMVPKGRAVGTHGEHVHGFLTAAGEGEDGSG